MDIGLFIVLMIVVYVVPEILKRMKKRKPYSYPPIPMPPPMPPQGSDAGTYGIPGELSAGTKPPGVSSAYRMSGEGTAGDEGDPDWDLRKEPIFRGEISTAAYGTVQPGDYPTEVVQGVVWAEIFSPPISKRTAHHDIRRRRHGTMQAG